MFNRIFGSVFAPGPGSDRIHMTDPREIKSWYDSGETLVLDVRENNEYAVEHIPGALHIPLSQFDPNRVPHDVAKTKKLVIHCRSGARCGMAASRLMASGWEGEIYRMSGGLMGWKSVGGPTER